MNSIKKEIQLKVVEALQDYAYKGIARIDSEIMRELDIRRGDVILIKGNKETVKRIADSATSGKIHAKIWTNCRNEFDRRSD